jgi:hypothetical protein
MNLSRFHDSRCEFNILTRVDLSFFFFIFFIPSLNIELVGNWTVFLFNFLSIELSQSHDLSHRFDKLSRVDFVHCFGSCFN